MKIKTLSILFILCILLTSCNNADSVETFATVESTESVETITEIEEPTTIEEVESTVEVEETETVVEESTVEEVCSTEEVTTANEYEGKSPSDQEAIEDMAQQIIADYLREHAQDTQVDVPGGTPYDPSQDGPNQNYDDMDLPAHLKGSVTQ